MAWAIGVVYFYNAGIIGKPEEFNLDHLNEVRPSTVLFHLTQRLLYTKFRDPGEEPKFHLFGQLKRITREWLEYSAKMGREVQGKRKE